MQCSSLRRRRLPALLRVKLRNMVIVSRADSGFLFISLPRRTLSISPPRPIKASHKPSEVSCGGSPSILTTSQWLPLCRLRPHKCFMRSQSVTLVESLHLPVQGLPEEGGEKEHDFTSAALSDRSMIWACAENNCVQLLSGPSCNVTPCMGRNGACWPSVCNSLIYHLMQWQQSSRGEIFLFFYKAVCN